MKVLSLLCALLVSDCARYNAQNSMMALLLSPGAAATASVASAAASNNPVNQIQSGLINMTSATTNVAVNSVDTTKAMAFCYFRTTASEPACVPTCELASPTQITVQTGGNSTNYFAQWYLIEFASGALVQRGSFTFTGGVNTTNITLGSSVDATKSFVLLTARMPSTDHTLDAERLVRATITGPTTLTLTRNANSAINITAHWQVVQLQDASVQSGTTTIGAGASSSNVAISSVDLAKSFLFFNTAAPTGIGGFEERYTVRGRYSSSTGLTFTRASTTSSVDVSYFAVQMNDASSTQSGTLATSSFPSPNTATVMNATLTSVTPATAVAVISSSVQNTGGTQQSDLDSGSFVPQITSATNLQVERGSNQNQLATVDYFVVQFVSQ
ncbi:MAG: hypothetical protein K8S54_12040 [Spirochaetia bacterium]|nr:hypothetical protein [Spirochaetia bacterium]